MVRPGSLNKTLCFVLEVLNTVRRNSLRRYSYGIFLIAVYTMKTVYATVRHIHGQKKLVALCFIRVTDRLGCVTRPSDDALHRTRGDRPGAMSHATAVKFSLSDVFSWPICTIRASCVE